MSTSDFLKTIKDEEVAYVDIRFTDPRGKLQHVTVMSDQVDEDFLEEGFMFDGSSIAGWKSIDQSDMKLMPDTDIVLHGPVLRREDARRALHRGRARHQRDLRPRPARYRRKGGSLPQGDRDRRLRLHGAGGRVLPVRQRQVPGFDAEGRLSRSTRSTRRGTPTPTTRWATWVTAPGSRAATSP